MTEETILVVDDGKENRDFIVEYVLEPNGYTALVARDGLEGMELARQYRPDLILLDLQMPNLDGMGVIDALHAERLDIPVILMTFHGSEEIAIEVYRKGVKDYVKKPYTVEEMFEAIDRSLETVRLRKEKEQLTERLLAANGSLNQRVRELNTIYNIGKRVTSLMDMESLMGYIVEAAAELTSCEEGSLFFVEGEQLVCRAIRRHTDQKTYPLREARSDPMAVRAIRSRNIVVLSPDEIAALRQKNPSAPSAAMATPLVMGDRAIGALVVKNMSSGAQMFTRNDGNLLSALADYAAVAYSNASDYVTLHQRKEDEKASIREAFARFVAPSVVDSVLSDPEALGLGGTRREISVMFADIRNYSTFAEKAPPEQVVELLNEYFALAVDVVFAREGTLDKFLGDAVMAFFNAPTHQPDHVHRAAETALAMQKAVAEINASRGGGLQFGIGLHVGEAVVGYVGAAQAMTYTAIGDTVNVTQRIQEAARPGQLLVTELVARQIADHFSLRQLGKLPLRGREEEITVFELLGKKS